MFKKDSTESWSLEDIVNRSVIYTTGKYSDGISVQKARSLDEKGKFITSLSGEGYSITPPVEQAKENVGLYVMSPLPLQDFLMHVYHAYSTVMIDLLKRGKVEDNKEAIEVFYQFLTLDGDTMHISWDADHYLGAGKTYLGHYKDRDHMVESLIQKINPEGLELSDFDHGSNHGAIDYDLAQKKIEQMFYVTEDYYVFK